MPPNAPAIPPIPVTEATVFFGNISDTVVKMLADHAWCAEVAIPIMITASHIFMEPRYWAKTTGITRKAYISIDTFRARKTTHPFLIKYIGSQPPQMLPIVDIV